MRDLKITPRIGQIIIFQSIFPCKRNAESAKVFKIKNNPDCSFPKGIVLGLEFTSDKRQTYAGIDEAESGTER